MGEEWKSLADRIRKLVLAARSIAAHGVNTLQVATNFEVGRLIVEQEQKGKKRAEYGKRLLIELSRELTAELGRGYSLTNLKLMRQFYLEYSLGIGQTAPDRFPLPSKGQTASDRLPSRHEVNPSESGFIALSWSHYVFLLSIRCADERSFYEIESLEGGWSLRELKRQFDSGLYERLALSRDKKRIRDLSRRGQVVERPQDILKEPYVLEFLGLGERDDYSERDLETAIIGKLEHFLLELGKGFLFEGRQRRFTFGADHFFVDLVFYNRVLRCYVLVDLKLGRLAHQDLGQMQMYVNYFDRHVRSDDENPTIGVILCKTKNDALVELTLPENTNVYPAEYRLYLPSKKELRLKLLEWSAETEARR